MRFILIAALLAVIGAEVAPAGAQFTTSYAFIKAVRESDLVEARQLIKKGLTANVRDSEGEPVFVTAASNGDLEMLKFLQEFGANINARSRADGQTALMRAVEKGHQPSISWLLDNEVDLDTRDKRGETALIKAAKLRRSRLVEQLVDAGADIDVVDFQGWTALDHARNARARRVVQKLEDAG